MATAVLWSHTRAAGLNHSGKITKNARMVRELSGLCLLACQDFFPPFLDTSGWVTPAVAACEAVASHS